MLQIFLNRFPFARQFAKFVVVGTLNTGIDFFVLNVAMTITGITSGPSMFFLNAISFLAATTNSYFLNKHWTFEDKEKQREVAKASQFLTISIIGLTINSTIVYFITSHIIPIADINPQIWANIAKVAATAVSLVWNFVGYKFWVFKK